MPNDAGQVAHQATCGDARRSATRASCRSSQLPGTRMTPDYECGGNDVTISTLIGPQTLRTNGAVTFAYVLEHKSH